MEPMRGERGTALVAAVLLVVATMLLAHGALLLADVHLRASEAAMRLTGGRLLAESAVREAGEGAPRRSLPAFPGGADTVVVLGLAGWAGEAVAVRRALTPETWWVEGWGRQPPGTWQVRARLLWRLNAERRVAAAEGAVVTAVEGAPGLTISAAAFMSPWDPAPPGGCDELVERVASHRRGGALPPQARTDSARVPRLGALDLERLLLRTAPALTGTVRPAPATEEGRCTAQLQNWGDPTRPGGACAGHMVTRSLAPGARVEDGAGQGFVVAAGDVTLSGVQFFGMLLARGRVTLRDGAVVTGLLRAREVRSDGTGAVRASACWAAAALQAAPLSEPIWLGGNGWVGPLAPLLRSPPTPPGG